jgi:hypothetical protein
MPSRGILENASDQFEEVHRSVVGIQSRLTNHNQLDANHVYKSVNVLLNEAERAALAVRVNREPSPVRSDFERLDLHAHYEGTWR